MKKTLNITIGGTLFHIEEDAYDALHTYINSVRKYFEGNDDKDEILKDIESRIAERFSEKGGIVSMEDVDAVIQNMGNVNQFDENGDSTTSTNTHTHVGDVPKKLYRDKDTLMLAGVCAGLGHYFGVDPLIFRTIFFASIFLGGTGLIAYIILWILVPEAKTTSEKHAMKGAPVTLSSVAEMIKGKIEEVRDPKRNDFFDILVAVPVQLIRALVEVIQNYIFPALRVIVGVGLTITTFMTTVAITIGLGIALFAATPTFIEGPLLPLAVGYVAHILVISLYLVALIPLIFGMLLGIAFISRKNIIQKTAAWSLLSLWFVAIIVAALTGSHTGMAVAEKLKNDPYYSTEERAVSVLPFSKLTIMDGQNVTLLQGKDTRVTMKGRGTAMDHITYTVTDGELIIKRTETTSHICVFCTNRSAEITVTVPNLSAVTLNDSSRLEGKLTGKALSLILDNSSSADLSVVNTAITITEANSSNVSIRGEGSTLTAEISNASELDAKDLEVSDATVKLANAGRATINTKNKLTVTATNGSTLEYLGNPRIEKKIDSSSQLELEEKRAEQQ